MSLKKGAHIGGVRTLECIRDRCRIDEDTGCWIWGLMCTGKSNLPMVRFEGKAQGVRRVVLGMIGRPVPDGWTAVRRGSCHQKCVNPVHLKGLNPSQYMRWLNANSTMNGVAHSAARTLALRRRSSTKIESVEQAEEIRMRVASGEDRGALADEFGVCRNHLNRIARGVNWVANATATPTSIWSFAASFSGPIRGRSFEAGA